MDTLDRAWPGPELAGRFLADRHRACGAAILSRSRSFSFRHALAAAAFATVAVLPALVSLQASPGFPVQAFTVDDGLYLQRAIGAWQGLDPYHWSYYENRQAGPLVDVALARPNAAVDLVAGWVAAVLQLSPAALAVFLDWICGALAFALLLTIFRTWAGPWVASGAAILAAFFPGVLLPEPILLLPTEALPALVNQPYIDHAAPAFRAVYTQVSYPIFLAVVLAMVRWLDLGSGSRRALLGIGVAAGLSGHGYFFPWMALAALGLGLPLAAAVARGRLEPPAVVSQSLAFLVGWLVGSIPGLWIMAINDTSGIVASDVLAQYWFLPVERLLLAVIALLLAWRGRVQDPERTGLLAFLALLLALETPLMNLQPVLRQGLAPYHFPGFYLFPLVTGGLFVLLVQWLKTAASLPLLVRFVCALPLLCFCFDSALGVRKAAVSLPLAEDLGWLNARLREEPGDSVFALSPFREFANKEPAHKSVLRNLPNFVSTLSGRYTLAQDWMFNEIDDDSDLRRELGMAWLLSGQLQPLWTPPDPIDEPGDLFTLTWNYRLMRRQLKLARHSGLFASYTPCAFVSDFRVDLLVHEPENDGPLAPWEGRFLTRLASSPHGSFHLYRFDQARARAKLCQGEVAAAVDGGSQVGL